MLTLRDLGFIGSDYAEKLQKVGIRTSDDLVREWQNGPSRNQLAQKTGISENLFDRWYHLFQLMSVDGVTPEYAQLLHDAGIRTLDELRGYMPEPLFHKLQQFKNQGQYTGPMPTLDLVRRWVQDSPVREGAVN